MSPRNTAVLAGMLAIAIVGAQIALPGLDLFHTWQYALALVVLAWIVIAYAAGALRGEDGGAGKRVGFGLIGVLVVIAAGLASGLLGPDTVRMVRAPGTIAPLPDLGAAAFFSNADPASVARGDASVILRRRGRLDIVVTPGSRKFIRASILTLEMRPAAYVEATDDAGNHLTITQPNGASFLSPVLVFRETQAIAGAVHPVDGFSLPAKKLTVKVVYFTAEQTSRLHLPPEKLGKPALLYDVLSSEGRPLGIAIATGDEPVATAGVRLRATLGAYPQLLVASVPHPYALAFGTLLFLIGIAAASFGRAAAMPASPKVKPAPTRPKV